MTSEDLMIEVDELTQKMLAELKSLRELSPASNQRPDVFENFIIGKLAVLQVGLQNHLRRIKAIESKLKE
ncbi:hypothetical protein ACLUTX_18110 [Enterobacterales bacterium AE_CKDN230030158-1A_HGKHYDSX7]